MTQTGTAIFTACMNRNDNLLKVIDSWISCEHIHEIVIVDWSSTTRVIESLASHLLITNKIKIVEVTNQPRWVLSWAFNLAARFTTYDKILKLDCDYLLTPDFVSVHPLTHNKFYSGDWKCARNTNEKYLNGAVYLHRHNFFSVNGYSEYIQTYGWDDSDLYNRLREQNLTQIPINNNHISHLSHDSIERQSRDTFNDIHYNRFLVTYVKWSPTIQMNSYTYIDAHAVLDNKKYEYYIVNMFKNLSIVSDEIKRKTQSDLDDYLLILKRIEDEKTRALEIKRAQEKLDLERKEHEQLIKERLLEEKLLQDKLELEKSLSKLALNSSEMNTFYINVRNGMGNKLRALASAHTLFKYLQTTSTYNRFAWKLVIIWEPDHHCLAQITDLFTIESVRSSYPDNISVISSVPTDLPSDSLKLYGTPNNDENHNPTNLTINEFLSKIATSTIPLTIYLESACVLAFPSQSWIEDCKYLSSLKYSAKVLKIYDRLVFSLTTKNLQLSDLIGLHIRIGQDDQSFDDISGWSQEKQKQWNHWRKTSNYDNFVNIIEKELDKGCKGFYLASDTKWVYKKLAEQFPGKIFYLERDIWDRSVDQVITGLVDVVALTNTQKLMGSNWSSFTELAKRLKNSLPLKLAGVDF